MTVEVVTELSDKAMKNTQILSRYNLKMHNGCADPRQDDKNVGLHQV